MGQSCFAEEKQSLAHAKGVVLCVMVIVRVTGIKPQQEGTCPAARLTLSLAVTVGPAVLAVSPSSDSCQTGHGPAAELFCHARNVC